MNRVEYNLDRHSGMYSTRTFFDDLSPPRLFLSHFAVASRRDLSQVIRQLESYAGARSAKVATSMDSTFASHCRFPRDRDVREIEEFWAIRGQA